MVRPPTDKAKDIIQISPNKTISQTQIRERKIMEDFNKKLDEYAKLIVNFGANVQAGKPVRISCPVDSANFARMLASHAYARGASEVKVIWQDDFLTKERYLHASEDVLKTVHDFTYDELEYYYESGVTSISIYAEDPELLNGIDPERIKMATEARSKALKPLMKYTMNDICSWIVVSIPTMAWAEKVYPDLKGQEAMDRLWEDIFKFTRVEGDGRAIEKWEDHLATLGRRAQILNDKQFKELRYKSDNGTDLTVGLAQGHIWGEAKAENAQGVRFVPNMPTEEIYTCPDMNRVDGILKSTRPLSYNGVLIDGMTFKFEGGRVVEYSAESGQESLDILLNMDEGAKRLGEVALVPHDSPISNAQTIYYNTLFDENASCHFAFGKAYPTTIQGGEDMTEEELKARGVNDSLIHEDFMVGSESLSIIGIEKDGSEFTIFENGNFVF